MEEEIDKIITTFSTSWPNELWDPVSKTCLNEVIRLQIKNAIKRQPSSLPFFSKNKVNWITFGPNLQDVRLYYSRIQNWCFPYFAQGAGFTDPHSSTADLTSSILALSPAGYFKWESPHQHTETILKKIFTIEKLLGNAPPLMSLLEKTITQLRQEFVTRLAVNDRAECETIISEINQRGLDTAVNIIAMRIHMLWHFGEYQEITYQNDVDLLLSTNTPRHIRRIILTAFHSVFCFRFEEEQKYSDALEAYQIKIEPLISSTGLNLTPDDEVCAKLCVYSNLLTSKDITNDLRSLINDSGFVNWVSKKRPPSEFQNNLGTNEVQKKPIKRPSWDASLQYILNEDASTVSQLLRDLQETPEACVKKILKGDILLSIFSNPEVMQSETSSSLADEVLTAIIEALILFPVAFDERFADLFTCLLEIWANKKAHLNDDRSCNFLMYLANGALEIDPMKSDLVHFILLSWWEKKPIRARLPWLIEAIEILSNQTSDLKVLDLWYKGTNLIHSDPSILTRTDKEMMINLGGRFGIEKKHAYDVLGLTSQAGIDDQHDPLAQTTLSQIAIVSLHQRSANVAAEIIRKRSGCEVLVVDSHENDYQTKAATDKDLVLFVWSATKHSVYRAFDSVREKLCYVQGSGAASIVRALESHVQKENGLR